MVEKAVQNGTGINHGVASCQSFGGLRPDEAVTTLVLDTLQPLGVEAATAAWESSRQEQDLKTKTLALALEKARYEAESARR